MLRLGVLYVDVGGRASSVRRWGAGGAVLAEPRKDGLRHSVGAGSTRLSYPIVVARSLALAMKRHLEITSSEARSVLELDAEAREGGDGCEDGAEVLALKNRALIKQELNTECCKERCMSHFTEKEIVIFRLPLLTAGRRGRLLVHATNASIRQHAATVGSLGGRPRRGHERPLWLPNDGLARRLCVHAYKLVMGVRTPATWAHILELARQEDPAMHLVRTLAGLGAPLTTRRRTPSRWCATTPCGARWSASSRW